MNWIEFSYFAVSSMNWKKISPQPSHESRKMRDENWKIKIQSISNIFLLLNLYLFYAFFPAFSSQRKAFVLRSLYVDQWKKSSEEQNDGKAMRWREQKRKTNFMAFSWLYFLRKIVLFMSLRYTKLFALHAFAFSVLLYWKIMSFV